MIKKLGMTAAIATLAISPVLAKDEASTVTISKWDAAPVFEGDGWEFKVGGRLMYDYSSFDTDAADITFSQDELRRFRINAGLKLGTRLAIKAEINIGDDGDVILEDAHVKWSPTADDWNIQVGQFKTQNSLEEQASSRFISTFERGAFTDAFELNRRLGVALNAKGERHTFSIGAFGENIEGDAIVDGFALAGRGTYNPIKSENTITHLGASFRYRETGDGQSALRYRQKPYINNAGRIISTGRFADSDLFLGLEAAAIHNRFWAAGEYGLTFAECRAAAACSDATFGGGYIETGVFFGGRRGYKGGKFARPKIDKSITKGGPGALALVLRADTIDLNDSGINGGSLDTYVVGAEWWPTRYAHVGINFFQANADLGASTSGLKPKFADLVTAGVTDENATGVLFRAQFDF